MPDDYKDIMHLSRPQYPDLHPMSMSDRAAQFSPFAALVGYGDAVAETARLVDSRIELTEDEENALNAALNRLLYDIGSQPEVRVTYFLPDGKKAGGKYVQKTGRVRTFDSLTRELVFTDGARIAVNDMSAAEFPVER
ncbi:MAG: hypothetical protein IJR91_05115 [Ruminococcus sp.]|nr:hypothetical protein [Ruminococcus sp.]